MLAMESAMYYHDGYEYWHSFSELQVHIELENCREGVRRPFVVLSCSMDCNLKVTGFLIYFHAPVKC